MKLKVILKFSKLFERFSFLIALLRLDDLSNIFSRLFFNFDYKIVLVNFKVPAQNKNSLKICRNSKLMLPGAVRKPRLRVECEAFVVDLLWKAVVQVHKLEFRIMGVKWLGEVTWLTHGPKTYSKSFLKRN